MCSLDRCLRCDALPTPCPRGSPTQIRVSRKGNAAGPVWVGPLSAGPWSSEVGVGQHFQERGRAQLGQLSYHRTALCARCWPVFLCIYVPSALSPLPVRVSSTWSMACRNGSTVSSPQYSTSSNRAVFALPWILSFVHLCLLFTPSSPMAPL